MTKWQKILLGLLLVTAAGVVSCTALQNKVTPCQVSKRAAIFAEEPVKDCNIPPWTTIADAQRIIEAVQFKRAHENVNYRFAMKQNDYLMEAVEARDNFFSPSGAGGLLLGATALGYGWLGLSKPADRKRITELENGNKS